MKSKKINKEIYQEEDEGIYSEETRKTLVEDDEISAKEEAFMRGYDNA